MREDPHAIVEVLAAADFSPQIRARVRRWAATERSDPKFLKEGDVGAQIRKSRLAKGLTQEDLVNLAGMRRPDLSNLETGRHVPTIKTIDRLAKALGTTRQALLSS